MDARESQGGSQVEARQLLERVRLEFDGQGNGVVNELQDLAGEIMWDDDNLIIGYYAFREKTLSEGDWDQYTELFRFFVHFHLKIGHQVERIGIVMVTGVGRRGESGRGYRYEATT
jgi:hypothetical protein